MQPERWVDLILAFSQMIIRVVTTLNRLYG